MKQHDGDCLTPNYVSPKKVQYLLRKQSSTDDGENIFQPKLHLSKISVITLDHLITYKSKEIVIPQDRLDMYQTQHADVRPKRITQ